MACPGSVGEEIAQDIIRGTAPGYRGLSTIHPHRRCSVPVAKGSTHINHTGVSSTCRHAPPSHIHGHRLVLIDL